MFPKLKLSNLSKKPFVRNVATVATGAAAAQAIGIAFSPLITRLYGPEAFGLLGTFMALVAVLTPIASLCYPIAIVLPKKDEDARALVKLSIYISLGMALMVTLLLLIGGDWLLVLVSAEAISAFKFLIPLNLLFAAWLQVAQQWLIRKKQFKVKAKAAVAQALVVNGVKTGIGAFHPFAAVLIVMSSLGHLLHSGLLFLGINRHHNKDLRSYPLGNSTLKFVAKNHRDFPLFRAPQALINAISHSLPVLMLAAFFGPASAGFYTIGKKVLSTPSRLIGQSVTTVFYPKITRAVQDGQKVAPLIAKATYWMAGIGVVPFAAVFWGGPWVFGFVFGGDWVIAGEYARWVSVWLFFGFLNRPSVAAIPVLKMHRHLLIWDICSAVCRALTLMLGFYYLKDDVLTIMLFSLLGALLNLYLVFMVIRRSQLLQK